MERDRRISSTRPLPRRTWVARGLLLLYLLHTTPLAPLWTALLAITDPSHHVTVQQSTQGLRVVLRHDGANPPSHQHGVIADTLSLFAQRTTPAHSDHVIQFSPACMPHRTATASTAADLGTPAPSLGYNAQPLPSALAFTPAAPRRPPVAPNAVLLLIRSTVLVV